MNNSIVIRKEDLIFGFTSIEKELLILSLKRGTHSSYLSEILAQSYTFFHIRRLSNSILSYYLPMFGKYTQLRVLQFPKKYVILCTLY